MANPDYILYAQHGWADVNQGIGVLASQVASPGARVVVPNLGFVNTWIRIEPLVDRVEAIALQTQAEHPEAPIRIVGHSMGGLIWLEVLARHPEWWPRVESFVLVASPVGGADLGRFVDPFEWGIGIARDLGMNRRPLAERIAAEIPTLIISGDYDGGSDEVVPVECTKFHRASYVAVHNIDHDRMKKHPAVAQIIQQFWHSADHLCVPQPIESYCDRIIRQLQTIPGLTDAHYRGFESSVLWSRLLEGLNVRTWQNRLGIHHVFLANAAGDCLFAGFVGWPHTEELYEALWQLRTDREMTATALSEMRLSRLYELSRTYGPVLKQGPATAKKKIEAAKDRFQRLLE